MFRVMQDFSEQGNVIGLQTVSCSHCSKNYSVILVCQQFVYLCRVSNVKFIMWLKQSVTDFNSIYLQY